MLPGFATWLCSFVAIFMRIKIIGDNNCARAARHLLRLGGFAVTEFLPAEAVAGGPHAGYAITIDLAPATHSPDACLRPEPATQDRNASGHEEAGPLSGDASSPSFSADAAAVANFRSAGAIHFDSVESELEAAVLRHVAQLSAAPVIVDRPGGVVRSDRELRIVLPNSGDAAADEAAAVAVEFGILRGMLDLVGAANRGAGGPAEGFGEPEKSGGFGGWRKWWPFGVILGVVAVGFFLGRVAPAASRLPEIAEGHRLPFAIAQGKKPVLLKPVLLEAGAFSFAQGQFATGQEFRISDGTNFLVVDPCKGQTKLFAGISQTGNTQLVAGTAAKKIYLCSVHVVVAAATNVAVVEGTGSVCATGTAGVSGFGGATAATGWNFAANGGIALGNGDSSLGAEGTAGDNLCVFNSGSGQVSGGISYVLQ